MNIELISTSEIRISVVTRRTTSNEAVRAVHTAFGLDSDKRRGRRLRRHRPMRLARSTAPGSPAVPRSGARPTLAVVGATGAVGAVMLRILSQRADIWGEIRLVASPRSAGRKLTVRGEEIEVVALGGGGLRRCRRRDVRRPRRGRRAVGADRRAKGVVVVDNSGAFRHGPGRARWSSPRSIRTRSRSARAASSPTRNCTTLSMIVALGALHAEFGLRELVVSSYQAVSGAGPGRRGHPAPAAVAGRRYGTGHQPR